MDIKVGSKVQYQCPMSMELRTGEVTTILVIEDSAYKGCIGEKFCSVEYHERCFPDNIPMRYLKLIEEIK